MMPLARWQAVLLRAIGDALSIPHRGDQLLVLHFHRVAPQPDPLFPDNLDPQSFASRVDLLAQLFNVLPLSEALARIDSHSLPPRAACITFDDGYADNYEVALPILTARGLTATFYITTGFLGGGCMWNDGAIEALRRAGATLDLRELGLGEFSIDGVASHRRVIDEVIAKIKYREPAERLELTTALVSRFVGSALPNLMMTESQVRGLVAAGMEVGAHTVTHPILRSLDSEAARREIGTSRATLEAITAMPVATFAYPNGKPGSDYDRSHVEIVRELGFRAAFSTVWGCVHRGSDRMQLPRIAPWDGSALRYAARMLGSYPMRSPSYA